MKKTIYLGLSILFATATTFAQTTDADKEVKSDALFISGLVNYKYQNLKFNDQKNNTFEFVTSAGYFVSNNILLGTLGGYSSSITKDSNGAKITDQSIFTGGVFARYIYTPHKQYSFFNEVSGVYARAKDNLTSKTLDGAGGAFSLGFIYSISKHFALQASYAGISYSSASIDEFNNSAAEGFTIGADITNLKIGAIIKI
jgi:outer membrane protein